MAAVGFFSSFLPCNCCTRGLLLLECSKIEMGIKEFLLSDVLYLSLNTLVFSAALFYGKSILSFLFWRGKKLSKRI